MKNASFQIKRGSTQRWIEVDPILLDGEPAYDYDAHKIKIGNGMNKWSELPYLDIDNVARLDADNIFSGAVIVPTPTADNQAANKNYVDGAIPTSIKNPYSLTITIGDTTVTYDGSEAKSIEIADGSEVAY